MKNEGEAHILASLPTRRDNIPAKDTPEQGCVELPEINLNCFVFPPNVCVTRNQKCFDFPTHVYGHQLDTFQMDTLNEIYKIEDSDYEIWGELKPKLFKELKNCLRNSRSVKRKYKRMLS